MNRVETFPVPVRGHADPVIQALMLQCGGVAAYGRWHILLGMLYDSDGVIRLSPVSRAVMMANLQFDDLKDLEEFIETLSDLNLIDPGMLERDEIINAGVCKQLDYIAKKQAAGKQGGRPRNGDKR